MIRRCAYELLYFVRTSRPSVSIFPPSGRHEASFTLQHANALRQTVQDFEWLILDDSPEP